jgi:hypothetical protein
MKYLLRRINKTFDRLNALKEKYGGDEDEY